MRDKKQKDAISTPLSNHCITGESSTNLSYKKLSILDQFRATEQEFFKGFFTMKTIAVILDIDRANVCRYVATLRKYNRIQFVKKGICPITKCSGVGFYTTNPVYFVKSNQLELFPLNTVNHGK
jgi:hypothetical protein